MTPMIRLTRQSDALTRQRVSLGGFAAGPRAASPAPRPPRGKRHPRPPLRGAGHAHAKKGGWDAVCAPLAFCASKIPSFLARWRVRGPAGTGSVGDSVGEGREGGGEWCGPGVFCPSRIPSFLARWRAGPRAGGHRVRLLGGGRGRHSVFREGLGGLLPFQKRHWSLCVCRDSRRQRARGQALDSGMQTRGVGCLEVRAANVETRGRGGRKRRCERVFGAVAGTQRVQEHR